MKKVMASITVAMASDRAAWNDLTLVAVGASVSSNCERF